MTSSEVDWPMEKVKHHLGSDTCSNNPPLQTAVLLSTGALNPVHLGHVAMLERASIALGSHYNVVGAFLSPSHDLYLQGKFGCQPSKVFRAKDAWLSAEDRALLCDAATAESELVSVGRWESLQEGHWPDFPEVALALYQRLNSDESVLAANGGREIAVLYVCGTDHYQKCGLQRGFNCRSKKTIGVCVVNRREAVPNHSKTAGRTKGKKATGDVEKKQELYPCQVISTMKAIYAVAVEDETSAFSSTMVRQAIIGQDTAAVSALLHPAVASMLLSASDA